MHPDGQRSTVRVGVMRISEVSTSAEAWLWHSSGHRLCCWPARTTRRRSWVAGRRSRGPDPPARKKIHREPAALKGLHSRIDAMIEADAAIATATIWQRLADDHGVTVAYPTLRTYVTNRRGPLQLPGFLRHLT